MGKKKAKKKKKKKKAKKKKKKKSKKKSSEASGAGDLNGGKEFNLGKKKTIAACVKGCKKSKKYSNIYGASWSKSSKSCYCEYKLKSGTKCNKNNGSSSYKHTTFNCPTTKKKAKKKKKTDTRRRRRTDTRRRRR